VNTHIWSLTEPFSSKVNFIDSNNVILGYDLEQSCCEHAFWSISETPDGKNPIYQGDNEMVKEIHLEGYCFDPNYCQQQHHDLQRDEGVANVATFKLVGSKYAKPQLPDLFVRLENHHNGYYGHGFIFRGAFISEGRL